VVNIEFRDTSFFKAWRGIPTIAGTGPPFDFPPLRMALVSASRIPSMGKRLTKKCDTVIPKGGRGIRLIGEVCHDNDWRGLLREPKLKIRLQKKPTFSRP